MIAGGALFGVFAALTRFAGFEYVCPMSFGLNQLLGLVAYILIIFYLIRSSLAAK